MYELMVTDIEKDPLKIVAIMHEYHQKVLKYDTVPVRPPQKIKKANRPVFRHMDRASLPNPENSKTSNNQRTSTSDSNSGGIRLHSWITEVANSEATSARVRAWLEGIEYESTLTGESKTGSTSSHSRGHIQSSLIEGVFCHIQYLHHASQIPLCNLM